ncbi:GNAT family N-acetyltransferase [Pectinatus haikarae]|uniref:ElaA protein n=1 Tax=Pectinatus haikarae TaxID=349096 RepID=A0ABT9YDG9_9FIRM|nr:GNAT family N-acetyltransferase [Pectinatus haikarae]MDQ0205079.1 ElaA protein [Pectinatus haikarae]
MELVVKRFEELSTSELYEILKARFAVFVVEQKCLYQDLDDKDLHAYHVFLRDENTVQAYLRVIDKGFAFPEVTIGRVLTMKRRCGLGSKIVASGIQVAKERMKADKIKIAAQLYVKTLYEKAGFQQTSDEFLECDIPHIQMTLTII